MTKKWKGWVLSGLLMLTMTSVGCQTWVAGMTLPSPHYLEHPPQYFPPSPPYPFERELAAMEAAAAAQPVAPDVEPLPAPAP